MNLKKLSQTLTKSSTPASRHSSERTNICLRLDLHGNVYNVRVQIELRHPTPGRLRIMSQHTRHHESNTRWTSTTWL